MSAPATCFENIIGLSRTDCPCVEDRPISAGVSESGLFLFELDGLSLELANSAVDCGESGLWAMGERAVLNAIEDTKADLMACLGDQAALRRQSTSTPSQIGDDKKAHGDGVALRYGYHGLTVQLAQVRGGTAKVQAIGTAFKNPTGATVTVLVYDRTTDTPIATYEVGAQANKVIWTNLPVPLELEMTTLGTTPARFWFVVVPDSPDMRAMNSRINCGCGGFEPYWDMAQPQYLSVNTKEGKAWAEWSMASGTMGNDITDREQWSAGVNQTQGLLLKMDFDCDQTTTFCPDVPNYRTDNVQKTLAHAVRYKAGANLITRILSSTAINRYTMTAGEVLAENRRRYETEYQNRILGYVCPMLAKPENINRYGDCLKCVDKWGMSVSTIRG